MKNIEIWAKSIESYKLLDSGNGQKLEEIGGIKIVRAEPRAWWPKTLNQEAWQNPTKNFEQAIEIGDLNIKAKIKYKPNSKHIGIFPEQFSEWQWIVEKLERHKAQVGNTEELNVLNLFGYTGIASLVTASAGLSREGSPKWGAKVTHVDASKASVDWARENQKLSGLESAPIRWIVDDVVKFAKKEISRGQKYDAIIMDPPSYGKGPKGEVWKIEEQLPALLKTCQQLLSDQPLFIIFNMYSTELSAISVGNLLETITKDLKGSIKVGELAIPQDNTERLLPMSIFALWQSD